MIAITNSQEYRYMISALCVINCMSKTFLRCSVLCNIEIFEHNWFFATQKKIFGFYACARVCVLAFLKTGKIAKLCQHSPGNESEWMRQKQRERECVREKEKNRHTFWLRFDSIRFDRHFSINATPKYNDTKSKVYLPLLLSMAVGREEKQEWIHKKSQFNACTEQRRKVVWIWWKIPFT